MRMGKITRRERASCKIAPRGKDFFSTAFLRMPRPVRPFCNEPRPLPPLPIHYINNAAGLTAARRIHKKRYDAWLQRRRRALARGECIPETVRASTHTLPSPARSTSPSLTPSHSQATQTHAIVPTHHPASTTPPSHVMIMLPASMVSLLTPPPAAS